MASMNLVFRPSTKPGRHPGSLSLRLIHNRDVKTITLAGCRVYNDEWDKQSQTIIYPEDSPRRAAYLEEVETRIGYESDLVGGFILAQEKQGRYTLDDLLALYRRKTDEGTLLGYTESLAEAMEKRGQYRTAAAYRTVTRGLVKYNNGEDVPLKHINACLMKDFEIHLKDNGRLPNTISYYMRNLRAIYNKAVTDKKIVKRRDENPFAGVYTGTTKTMKRALSLDEVQQLHAIDFAALFEDKKAGSREYDTAENLSRSWRYFSFCIYARGMSFVDMAYLRKDSIRSGFIRYVRKKTGQQIEFKVTGAIQEIIDSFAGETTGSPYIFPIIRDNGLAAYRQYEAALRCQNNRLKKLASLAGIKPISTHVARHTWASVGKLKNLPDRVISECLGHTSEKTTRIYLASLDNSVLDAANDTVISAILRPSAGTVFGVRL